MADIALRGQELLLVVLCSLAVSSEAEFAFAVRALNTEREVDRMPKENPLAYARPRFLFILTLYCSTPG